MLCLSRKQNESIFIGDDVEVKVIAVSGGRVRLAISAPPDVRVQRSPQQPKEVHGTEKV